MVNLVKPNQVKLDTRTVEQRHEQLAAVLATNLAHIQDQLVAKGHSVEEVISAVAKHQFGVTVVPFKPLPKKNGNGVVKAV